MAHADLSALATAAVQGRAALTSTPGVTGTIAVVVTGGPDGDERVDLRVVDGRPVELGDGAATDCTFTLPKTDAVAVAGGGLRPSVAFMRGRLKTAGDNGLVLGVLEVTAGADFAGWLTGLADGSQSA